MCSKLCVVEIISNKAMNVSLNDLTTELLIKIFKYLSFQDQLNLRLTCRRFNNIISSGMHLLLENDVLVTNQLKPTMQNRYNIKVFLLPGYK